MFSPPLIKLDVKSEAFPSYNKSWSDYLYKHYLKSKKLKNRPKLLESYPLISKYTKYYDEVINYGLRNNNLSLTGYNILTQIYSALNQAIPSNEEIILFRGIKSTDKFKIKDYKIGDELSDLGIMSKSSSVVAALAFAEAKCCLLILRYPNASRHLDLSSISEYNEDEYITYAGERFVVTDILHLSYKPHRYEMRALVLQYKDNISKPNIMINYQIDEHYQDFLNEVNQYRIVYFEDANLVYSKDNYSYFSTFSSNDYIFKHVAKDDSDRLYTIYASAQFKNTYAILDFALFNNIRYSRHKIESEYGVDVNEKTTGYIKGYPSQITNTMTGEIIIPRRKRILVDLYHLVFGNSIHY